MVRSGLFLALLLRVSLLSQVSGQALFVESGASLEAFDCDSMGWTESGLAVGLDGDRYDLRVRGGASSRCAAGETRWLADVWAPLTGRSYINFRVLWTPGADFHPRTDVLVEAFLPTGRLEPSLQVRRMDFAATTAQIVAPALAAYSGNQYYRVQLLAARADEGPVSLALSVSARRYRGDTNYLEIKTAAGREVTESLSGVSVNPGFSVVLGAQQHLGRLSASPHLGWAHDELLGGRVLAGLRIRMMLTQR